MTGRTYLRALAVAGALTAGCASGAGRSGAPSGPMPIMLAPADQRELLPDEQVQHVLNRLAFGGRPGDAAAVRAMGVDKWITQQLHPETIPDPSIEAALAKYPTLGSDRADL